jgi:DNA invertase Pin-like site-specific DNA recombinase
MSREPIAANGIAGRALIMCRQSITREASMSLSDQESHCQRYCETQRYAVIDVIRSPNVRGWTEDRKDHQLAKEYAAAKRIDVVVAYDVSRAARSVRLLEQFVHDLAKFDCRLELSSQPWANDSLGRQLLSVFAELETTQRRIRQEDGWEYRMSHGWWNGRAPFGYKVVRNERNQCILGINEDEWPIAERIWRRRLEGASYYAIATELDDDPETRRVGAGWPTATIFSLLSNPTYLGHTHRRGVRVAENTHPAMIDARQWEIVRSMDAEPGVREKTGRHWLEGLVWHECGVRGYFSVSHSRSRPGAPKYAHDIYQCQRATNTPARRCDVLPRVVMARKIEIAALAALTNDIEHAVTWQDALESLNSRVVDVNVARQRKTVEKRKRDIAARRETALELALSRRIDFARFDAITAELNADEATIDRELANLPKTPDATALRQSSDDLVTIGHAISGGSPEDIAETIRRLGRVVYGSRGVRIAYHDSYAPLLLGSIAPYPPDLHRGGRRKR